MVDQHTQEYLSEEETDMELENFLNMVTSKRVSLICYGVPRPVLIAKPYQRFSANS